MLCASAARTLAAPVLRRAALSPAQVRSVFFERCSEGKQIACHIEKILRLYLPKKRPFRVKNA